MRAGGAATLRGGHGGVSSSAVMSLCKQRRTLAREGQGQSSISCNWTNFNRRSLPPKQLGLSGELTGGGEIQK